MKRFFLSCIAAILIFGLQTVTSAAEKRDYTFIAAAGVNHPISEGTNETSPVIYASYWQYLDDTKNLYWEAGATTVTVFMKFGREANKYNAGIQPMWGHSVYGAYSDYYKGYSDTKNELMGFYAGPLFFFKYHWTGIFSTELKYIPNYHYYSETDENSNIEKPDPHFEHTASAELLLKNTTEKDFGIIKHGVMARFMYQYSHRTDYQFQDRPLPDGTVPELSDDPVTHRYYLDLGAYYNFPGDFNMKLDFLGSYQENVDRNNAEKIGHILADHAIVPGYFYIEFYHHMYAIAKASFGIPVPFWGMRIEPAYNVLYMPEENKVIGAPDYSREYWRSVSVSLSMKIANLVPLFIDYGYGFDAERRDKSYGEIKKGNHELNAVIVVAFGEIDHSGEDRKREDE
jgi:hypothetical protein